MERRNFRKFGRADRFTGGSSRKNKRNRVIAKETTGTTSPDSGRQIDIAGIRRLLGQTVLSHASTDVFFN
jgi:hypothetical protein